MTSLRLDVQMRRRIEEVRDAYQARDEEIGVRPSLTVVMTRAMHIGLKVIEDRLRSK